jgi:hypothetical protein
MSTTSQFIAGAEGLDIYPAGAIGNVFPWYQTNATYQGTIKAGAGPFAGNALAFAAASLNASGQELQFNSTMQVMKNIAAASGGSGAFGVCGWINVGAPVANGTDTLLGIGSSVSATPVIPLLGLTNSSTGGLNLVLPSSVSSLTSAPHLLAITPNTQYWVGVYFAYKQNAGMTATLCLSGTPVFTDVPITWTSDVFSAGQIANRLKFFSATTAPWQIDDVIIQAVSAADTGLWPTGTVTPETIPQFSPRQISLATVTGNGTLNQWSASGSQPNYQSATDPSGANSVIATAVNLTDRYVWNTQASDVKAVVYRGQSSRYGQISPVQFANGQQAVMSTTLAAPSEFIGISESDGTNPWTATSINAAEFGQVSHN